MGYISSLEKTESEGVFAPLYKELMDDESNFRVILEILKNAFVFYLKD